MGFDEVCCANCGISAEEIMDEEEFIDMRYDYHNNWYCCEDCYDEHTRGEG